MKKILILTLSLIAINSFANKIGFISIEKIMESSESFQEKQKQILNSFKAKDDSLKEKAQKLKKLIDEFSETKDDLTKQEKERRFGIISEKDKELKLEALKLQKQLNLSRQEELTIFQDKINDALQSFATDNNFDLILYKDIAFASKKIDITDQVIKLLSK